MYTFQRGETVLLALDVAKGSASDVTTITAKLRQQLAPHAEEVFQIAARPDGWTLTIAADVSEQMAAGFYEAQAKVTVGTQVIITDPVQVRLT